MDPISNRRLVNNIRITMRSNHQSRILRRSLHSRPTYGRIHPRRSLVSDILVQEHRTPNSTSLVLDSIEFLQHVSEAS